MRTHTRIDSPLGTLTLVATDGALSGVYLEGHRFMPDPAGFGPRVDRGFEQAAEQLGEYFAGRRREFTLRTLPSGSDFQRRVWRALASIPYGQTWSYARLAEAVGRPDAVRAVAAANASNPLSVVVPCHRVVGSDGSLVGYAGGLARKRFLLELERGGGRQGALF